MNTANVYENISPAALAKCIGKSRAFACQVTLGHKPLPLKYIYRVSQEFKIPVYKLRPDVIRCLYEDCSEDTKDIATGL